MATKTKTPGLPTANFRQRVGRERRERTRARILQSSFRVFAEKGHEQTAIDDVIKAAEVARGWISPVIRNPDNSPRPGKRG